MVGSIFFVSTGIKIKAEECNDCNQISTQPGNAEYCKMYPLKLDPTNPSEITAGNSIVIKVLDGSGPFIWEDPGKGYTWVYGDVIDTENPKRKKTNTRENTLQCASGTWGSAYDAVASIAVNDNCKDSVNAIIFNRDDTGWKVIQEGPNYSNTSYVCVGSEGTCYPEVIHELTDGNRKWEVTIGSNNPDAQCLEGENRNSWRGIYDENYPPCGGGKDCGHSLGGWNYCPEDGGTCYCKARYCTYYEWGCL